MERKCVFIDNKLLASGKHEVFPPIVWPPPEGASESDVTKYLQPFRDVLRFISAHKHIILQHPELYDHVKKTLDELNLLNGVLDAHRRQKKGQWPQQQYTGMELLDNNSANKRRPIIIGDENDLNNTDEEYCNGDDDDIPLLVRRLLNAEFDDHICDSGSGTTL